MAVGLVCVYLWRANAARGTGGAVAVFPYDFIAGLVVGGVVVGALWLYSWLRAGESVDCPGDVVFGSVKADRWLIKIRKDSYDDV